MRYIDGETIPHVSLAGAFKRFIDIIWLTHFDLAEDAVFTAKVNHLLRLFDSSDVGADEAFSLGDVVESVEL